MDKFIASRVEEVALAASVARILVIQGLAKVGVLSKKYSKKETKKVLKWGLSLKEKRTKRRKED